MRLTRHVVLIPLLGTLLLAVGCAGIDEETASAEILEEVCEDWPYGCTENTRVEIEKVRETPNGRSVDFRLVDRQDRSAVLSAAYFEPEDDGWLLLLFENPFLDRFKQLVAEMKRDREEVGDRLMELRSAQNWHQSIYGSYAGDMERLANVNYKPPQAEVRLSVGDGGKTWHAESDGSFVTCEIGTDDRLPVCRVKKASDAGSEAGPLATRLGER